MASANATGSGDDSDVSYSATLMVDEVYVDATAEYYGSVCSVEGAETAIGKNLYALIIPA